MPLDKDIENILDPLLGTFDERLEAEIAGQLTEVYISGQAEMITWGKTKGGIPIAYEGPPIQGAIDWAKSYVSKAKLVDGLNEETRRQISNVISDGIKNKRGIPGITRDIRQKFDWMARGAPSDIKGLTLKSRAEMIARTETATALSQSSLDNMEAMGIEGKEWVTVGDADVSVECRGNEAEGVIPVGKEFSGGVMAPGQHPNCRCALAPGRIKGKEKELSAQQWSDTLTGKEHTAFESWQAGGYDDIRKAQKLGGGDQVTQQTIRTLNTALDRGTSYKGEIYRGLNSLDDMAYQQISQAKSLEWNAFTSASSDFNTGLRFTFGEEGKKNVLFRIANKTGIDISEAGTAFAREKEVLMRAGTKYRVISSKEKVLDFSRQELVKGKAEWVKIKTKVLEVVMEEI